MSFISDLRKTNEKSFLCTVCDKFFGGCLIYFVEMRVSEKYCHASCSLGILIISQDTSRGVFGQYYKQT